MRLEYPDVAQLVPHAGRMILVDRIVAADAESLTAELVVRNDGIFSGADGAVPSSVGIEYMAQAIAAFAGHRARALGGKVRLGLLLGVRGFRAPVTHFFPGQSLTVSVRPVVEANGLGVFDCEINAASLRIQARLTVAEADSLDAL